MNFQPLLKKISDYFNKSINGNIGKLYRLGAECLEEVKMTFDTIQTYQDLDEAKGIALDRIVRDVLQQRGNLSDDEYRLMIKTMIRATLSSGDIETINEVAGILIGDPFTGIQEMWSVKNHPNAGEESALLLFLNRKDDMNILPFTALKRISSGGVAIYFYVNEPVSELEFSSPAALPIVHVSTYQICGTFSAGGEYEL
ncbi:hypothetical protein [Brevibacillus reuszeri]|uniref:hypothetical protein n=1 Tax=Brevibacillus reuszeri TaxID=54915 RepID=UPI00289BEAC6|nr:hypothetical protein [Brevibacillus reuszeri]